MRRQEIRRFLTRLHTCGAVKSLYVKLVVCTTNSQYPAAAGFLIELYVTRQKSPAGAMFPGETIRTADPASELQFACGATKETGTQQHFGLDHSLRVRACARRQRTGRRRRRSLRWAAGPRCCRSQWPSAASSMSRIILLSRAVSDDRMGTRQRMAILARRERLRTLRSRRWQTKLEWQQWVGFGRSHRAASRPTAAIDAPFPVVTPS